ncbi:MAG: sigma-70 family RNA polymerase sigma factor, partial [Actinomycetota bacterium]|nr:sigma-70 family RNA polymerase sigma factor [Actinomycetota bacterium]
TDAAWTTSLDACPRTSDRKQDKVGPSSHHEQECQPRRQPIEASATTSHDEIAALLPHLRAFARSLTSNDPHLADDLVQDTVVLALRAWKQFTPGTNLKAWLFMILRNHFRSLVGRRKHKTEALTDDVERRLSTPATQGNGLVVAEFKRAFAQLSPTHREVLVMVGVHGLAYEEVAEVCGCELGTVKSRVFRARALLKAMLLDEGAPAKPPASRASRKRPSSPALEKRCRPCGGKGSQIGWDIRNPEYPSHGSAITTL